jgi:hypothetical protein
VKISYLFYYMGFPFNLKKGSIPIATKSRRCKL